MSMETNRTERVMADRVGAAIQNCGMILAATHHTNPEIAGQSAEAQTILESAQITGQILIALNLLAIHRMLGKLIRFGNGQVDGDRQRTRAAQSGRLRQITRECDVGTCPSTWEVSSDPAHDRRGIRRPFTLPNRK